MTTSGTSVFTVTRDDIIDAANLKIQAFGEGVTMTEAARTRFANALNAMVKRWQAIGLHVWTESEAILFPQASQISYGMGTGATDHVTGAYYQTTTSAAAAAAATTLSVASTANMTAADNIGVLLDDGTIQWSTISSKTSTTVTIGAALTDSVASGNYVWNYTSKIVRPLRIVGARRMNIASSIETPIFVDARLDYMALPNKTQTGFINRIFYDPQLTIGYVKLWNPVAVIDTLLKFTYWRPIQDFSVAGDNPDLPQEWIDTLIFQLAVVMAPEYSVPMEKFNQIKTLADQFLDDLKGWDREPESVYFGVDTQG